MTWHFDCSRTDETVRAGGKKTLENVSATPKSKDKQQRPTSTWAERSGSGLRDSLEDMAAEAHEPRLRFAHTVAGLGVSSPPGMFWGDSAAVDRRLGLRTPFIFCPTQSGGGRGCWKLGLVPGGDKQCAGAIGPRSFEGHALQIAQHLGRREGLALEFLVGACPCSANSGRHLPASHGLDPYRFLTALFPAGNCGSDAACLMQGSKVPDVAQWLMQAG